ncbi:MAG: von Willebrand factor type A domain-containing protein [Rubripirellula sp.]
MNEPSHNPAEIDPTKINIEARIVAMLLGEASDLECDQLNRLIDERPELALIKTRFQHVHGLLKDVGAGESVALPDDWKLSQEKRDHVVAVIRGETPDQAMNESVVRSPATLKHLSRFKSRSFATVAVLLLVVGSVALLAIPAVNSARKSAVAFHTAGVDESYDMTVRASSSIPEAMNGAAMSVPEEDVKWRFENAGGHWESDDAAAPKSALSEIRESAIRDRLDPETSLPSPYYLQDDVQYFPSGPEFKLPREAVALQKAREEEAESQIAGGRVFLDVSPPQSSRENAGKELGTAKTERVLVEVPVIGDFAAAPLMIEQPPKSDAELEELLSDAAIPSSSPSQPTPLSGGTYLQFGLEPSDSPAGKDGRDIGGEVLGGGHVANGGFDLGRGELRDAFGGGSGLYFGKENASAIAMDTPRIVISDEEEKAATGFDPGRVSGDIHLSENNPTGPALPHPANHPVDAMKRSGEELGVDASGVVRSDRFSNEGRIENLERLAPAKETIEQQPAVSTRMSMLPILNLRSELKNKSPVARTAVPAGIDEKTAAAEAFSTFSLHVSDVSFKLAQAALVKGEWPEASKVRIEEFVNAFDYGDPMPHHDEKVACQVEQAIHPFLQQRNVLRVSMRTAAAGRASNTPLRLTFLLDNSGSMERIDRRQTVRRAFALLAAQLTPIDQVTLISFARQPRLLAVKVSGAESEQLVQLIDTMPSEGGTNIEAALQLAFEKAREQETVDAQNRIILLTDGAVNLGDANPESLSRMITTIRDAGIAFDAAGISADGLNDEVLEALTRKGDGRYYLLDSAESADDGFARQIAGALRPSAKNVKVQIEFNPNRVGRYKLLGFEKHLLKKEDFRNDTVDAAEMAAAEAGVAVYQFEAKPDGEGDVGSVSVRFRDLSTGQMVENRWPIPYEADALRVDQAAPSLRIAASAALFAAKLRGEPLGETVDLKVLSELISGLSEQDRNPRRVQQLKQMIEQARQLSGN